ncbi:hypothetical protein BR93DRAFT_661244 [Coniochaeta sp. PMI_546]|nr:hypothetical protein BR93DRAFT_661244 [Coniochaeta sp. PMI_546]
MMGLDAIILPRRTESSGQQRHAPGVHQGPSSGPPPIGTSFRRLLFIIFRTSSARDRTFLPGIASAAHHEVRSPGHQHKMKTLDPVQVSSSPRVKRTGKEIRAEVCDLRRVISGPRNFAITAAEPSVIALACGTRGMTAGGSGCGRRRIFSATRSLPG